MKEAAVRYCCGLIGEMQVVVEVCDCYETLATCPRVEDKGDPKLARAWEISIDFPTVLQLQVVFTLFLPFVLFVIIFCHSNLLRSDRDFIGGSVQLSKHIVALDFPKKGHVQVFSVQQRADKFLYGSEFENFDVSTSILSSTVIDE